MAKDRGLGPALGGKAQYMRVGHDLAFDALGPAVTAYLHLGARIVQAARSAIASRSHYCFDHGVHNLRQVAAVHAG